MCCINRNINIYIEFGINYLIIHFWKMRQRLCPTIVWKMRQLLCPTIVGACGPTIVWKMRQLLCPTIVGACGPTINAVPVGSCDSCGPTIVGACGRDAGPSELSAYQLINYFTA